MSNSLIGQYLGHYLRDLRKKMAKYEKQRTVEEIKQEELIAERTKILQDLLHKNTSSSTN